MELSNLTLLSGETFDENVLGAVAWRQRGKTPFKVRCCTIMIWSSSCCMRNRKPNVS